MIAYIFNHPAHNLIDMTALTLTRAVPIDDGLIYEWAVARWTTECFIR